MDCLVNSITTYVLYVSTQLYAFIKSKNFPDRDRSAKVMASVPAGKSFLPFIHRAFSTSVSAFSVHKIVFFHVDHSAAVRIEHDLICLLSGIEKSCHDLFAVVDKYLHAVAVQDDPEL